MRRFGKRSPLRGRQSGFTLVELMIASLVFSSILLLCTVGLITISRSYFNGVTTARTQETARAIIDEISQAIQNNSVTHEHVKDDANQIGGFCIGSKVYGYRIGVQLKDSPALPDQSTTVFRVADTPACGAGGASMPAGGRELMGINMRLMNHPVVERIEDGLYRVSVTVINGDNDLIDFTENNCKIELSGSEFCAVSNLSTTVRQRL